MHLLTSSSHQQIMLSLSSRTSIQIHWLDNYARYLSRLNIYMYKEAFQSMLWTVHGVKIWPSNPPLSMSYIYSEGRPCRAMQPLDFLLSDDMLNFISQS